MKKILILICFGFSLSHAESLDPVNFHKDKRPGQVSAVTKIVSGNDTHVSQLKFCFSSGDLRTKDYALPTGCTIKKLVDSEQELKYEAECKDTGVSIYQWKRLSENVFEATVICPELRLEQKSTYDGPTCDADAIRK